MPNPWNPFDGDSGRPKSEFQKRVEAFFDDPLISEPKALFEEVKRRMQIRRDGKRLVALCENVAREVGEAVESVIVPLEETDEDLLDIIDLRSEEVTEGDFIELYGDGTDRPE
jgi:hypothetical protein